MTLIIFGLLWNVATAQERTLAELDPTQVEWIQMVVDNVGRELVYTEGVYVLPVLHTAEFAVAEQFALDHDSDLRTLSPEGVKVGAIDPTHPRVWFRPGVPALRIADGDSPRFDAWPIPENPLDLARLIQVHERLEQTPKGGDQTALLKLRQAMVREACGAGL